MIGPSGAGPHRAVTTRASGESIAIVIVRGLPGRPIRSGTGSVTAR